MSINGGSAKNSANIEQQDYKDERSQKWIAVKQTNGGIVFLSALDADYCVDLQAVIAAKGIFGVRPHERCKRKIASTCSKSLNVR